MNPNSCLPFSLSINLCLHCVKIVQMRSFFWSVFSCIRAEYGDIRSKSQYLVRIQENTDHKNSLFDTFHAVLVVVNIRTNLRLLAASLSKYVWIYIKLLLPGTDYSSLDESQILWYQFGKKTCYILKVSKFYVEKISSLC